MGYAAYWRGSKAISEGIARDAYRNGLSWYNPDAPAPKPKPRPADWGDKTAARAADVVARHLRAVRLIAECREQPFTWTQEDEDMAIDNLSERHRIGKSTLRTAFESMKGTPCNLTPTTAIRAASCARRMGTAHSLLLRSIRHV